MNDVVSLGGTGRRRRWTRLAAAAAALGLVAAGVVGHLHAAEHHAARVTGHALDAHADRGGPVQLAGLGSAAARQLNHADSPTIAR
ncbi:MAG TPA: hypothetical protein VFW16_13815 [Streptosporangiaceae bacterium]|nr:hypothetical protein [Streptosporangiaceae bacterium]